MRGKTHYVEDDEDEDDDYDGGVEDEDERTVMGHTDEQNIECGVFFLPVLSEKERKR